MKAERDRRQTILEAEGHKATVITRAEGDRQAMILAAEGERDAKIARAEGEAKAVQLAKEAEAAGLRAINGANPTLQALELRKYDAPVALANGQAAKIIIPSDVANMAGNNVVFSETAGIGTFTKQGAPPAQSGQADPCCENKVRHGVQDGCQLEAVPKQPAAAQPGPVPPPVREGRWDAGRFR